MSGQARGETANGVRVSWSSPSGLPLLSTEPLTAAEREQLRHTRRAFQLVVETFDELLQGGGRVDQALDLLNTAEACGTIARQVALQLGKGR